MDILSQKTLTILSNEKVGRALDELLDPHRTTDTKTVELTNSERHAGGEARPAGTRVRIRRIA
jgi:hypothetical protein